MDTVLNNKCFRKSPKLTQNKVLIYFEYPAISQVLLSFHLNRIDIIKHKNKVNVNHSTQSYHPSSQSHSPNNTSEGKSSCYWGTTWDCYPLVRDVMYHCLKKDTAKLQNFGNSEQQYN